MTIRANSLIYLFLITLILSSCGTRRAYFDRNVKNWKSSVPPDSSQIKYSVFLIGDAGEPSKNTTEPTLALLRNHIYERVDTVLTQRLDSLNQICYDTSFNCYSVDNNNTVVFLGDNIYYKGLPEEGDRDRKEMERKLVGQLDIIKDFKGRKIMIPGNHDWNEMKPGGLEAVNREERFVEQYLGAGNTFLPDNGCPGPVEVQIGPDLTMIVIDSEWWLYKHYKPMGPENGCNVNSKYDFIVQLQDMVEKNKDKNILICLHHPLFSNGNHGGHYSIKDYIFPLTLLRSNLYIPLPVIGSLYPLMRKYGISPEDLSNPNYQQLKNAILSVVENEKNVVIAAGHEHNLQYRKYKELNHIVSGSGSKDKHAIRGDNSTFVHDHKGFAKINYYQNGEAWVEFWEPDKKHPHGKLAFRTPMYALTRQKPTEVQDFECRDSTIMVAASKNFSNTPASRFFFGEHYRKDWATPVKAHLLDLKCEAGGLTPISKGGGNQTTSIRLRAADSSQYTLRMIEKDPAALLPPGLRRTFAGDLLEDQMSSAHPYGALVIPPLADAVKVLHTNPQLFYVPYTPILGNYLDDIGNRLAILEERPDEDMSEFPTLGSSKNLVSTRTMYEKIMKSNNNTIDERLFLRSRLFDIYIGDWDRHFDQWRWGEFELENGKKLYKPVPRDRDQAFVKYDGLVPYIVTRKWAGRMLHTFKHDYQDIIGLTMQGSTLDKTLITELTLKDWQQIADSMRISLTDSIIEAAVKRLPPEVYPHSGEELVSKLKSRRDRLTIAALKYYTVVSKKVEVIGSDKKEIFEVNRLSDEETSVSIFQKKDDGSTGDRTYHRVFKTTETKEIILHALGNDDVFRISGNVNDGILIRAIGGEGKDVIIDSSHVKGISRKTIYYDIKKGKDELYAGSEAKIKLTTNTDINEYKTYQDLQFKYNSAKPKLLAEYNPDEGVSLGAGVLIKRYGFGKAPASAEHFFGVVSPINTQGLSIRYKGIYYSILRQNWDVGLDAIMNWPRFELNYFGQSNESVTGDLDTAHYRIRLKSIDVAPYISHRFTEYFNIGVGPTYEYNHVASPDNSFIRKNIVEEMNQFTESSHFWGGRLFSWIDLTDDTNDPTRGVKWRNEISHTNEINGKSINFTRITSDFSFYITPKGGTLPLTIALRFGGATNLGDYKFYQSSFLGGRTNLRGFLNTRYAGRSSVYQNTEFRFRLFEFRNNLLTGKWGLLAFLDQGRVWADSENSTAWHMGYGPGVWIKVYNLLLISGTYGFSKNESNLRIRTGFAF